MFLKTEHIRLELKHIKTHYLNIGLFIDYLFNLIQQTTSVAGSSKITAAKDVCLMCLAVAVML